MEMIGYASTAVAAASVADPGRTMQGQQQEALLDELEAVEKTGIRRGDAYVLITNTHPMAARYGQMNDGVMAAQAFVFFAAGFETSSTTMSFALHELAVNTDIQEKVRKEIDTSLEETGGEFTYESIMNLKYLDKVVSEQTSDLSTRKVII
ncbi:Cytochrome P450 6a9 [Gryllus bimaculatus]|nr:Cytochrome P450 6a9 [Gryllus bimaculatus]